MFLQFLRVAAVVFVTLRVVNRWSSSEGRQEPYGGKSKLYSHMDGARYHYPRPECDDNLGERRR